MIDVYIALLNVGIINKSEYDIFMHDNINMFNCDIYDIYTMIIIYMIICCVKLIIVIRIYIILPIRSATS